MPVSTMEIGFVRTGFSTAEVSGSPTRGAGSGVVAEGVALGATGVGEPVSPTPSQTMSATPITPPMASHRRCSSVRRRRGGLIPRGDVEACRRDRDDRRGGDPAARGGPPRSSDVS